MAVHGHVLIWHSQNPSWLENGNWSESQLIGLMNDHIDTVAGRYAGDVLVWDVVNEAFNEDGTYRSTIWYNGIGQEYMDMAFQRARAADPNAKLIYNDYNIGWLNNKSNGVYNMVSSMVSRGIPIDGVGFQMHLTESGVAGNSFASNMQRFADLGLEVYITELDVRIPENPSSQNLQNQANVYETVTNRCLAQPACKGLQVWGIPDKYSWVPDVFPGTGAPLLFDDNYEAKPAYYAVQAELATLNPLPTATPGGPTPLPTSTSSAPTATAVPNETPTSAPPTATSVPPTGTCVVDYDIVNQWGNGFQANVTIHNNTNAAIAGWTLNWTHVSGQGITSAWNADVLQTGNDVSASNPASHWNGTITANGSVSFGFQGSLTGISNPVVPTDFVLNGVACNEGDPQPTATTLPPTATSIPPTATTQPPTTTAVPPTPTSAPPTATAVPPTATPSSSTTCAVAYDIVNQWNDGFQVNITITNLGNTAVQGYTLAWNFGNGQQYGSGWNATFNQSGTGMTASNVASYWNGTIGTNGGSVSFGFVGSHSGTVSIPTNFTLNGSSCDS
jgi:endo-1,4-beta-xylanase